MEFQKRTEAGVAVFELEGELVEGPNDSSIADMMGELFDIDSKKCILDIQQIKYINSAGIAGLLSLLTKTRNQGGEMWLASPSEHVQKLLIMTKLQNIFNIAPSVDKAIEKINA